MNLCIKLLYIRKIIRISLFGHINNRLGPYTYRFRNLHLRFKFSNRTALKLLPRRRVKLFASLSTVFAGENIPVAMLRSLTCSSTITSTSLFFRSFRQHPRSYLSPSSSTTVISASGRNIRRLSTLEAAGRQIFLRRGLKLLSAASRGLNGQFSRLSIRAVATQSAPSSYPGEIIKLFSWI